jgi:hypothetical protein
VKRLLFQLVTHGAALAIGFALGIYYLPILTAPDAPSTAEVESLAGSARYTAEFHRDLEGSDFLHWGEGKVSVGPDTVSFMGAIAPGPDYKLYLVPEFVQTEAEFEAIRDGAVRVGDIKTFDNFIVPLADSVDLNQYTTVLVWCESFSEFITAARYR